MLVEAPAGLGKTSLLGAAADTAAERGFACLRARASDLERDFAYGCVRQLLEPLVAKASGDGDEALFNGAAAHARSLFAATPSAPSADSSYAMLHGLYWLLNNVAEAQPVALIVDDLHWADTESLRFLDYLAPRLDGLSLAVVAGTRSGEGNTAELARLAAAPETTLIRPRALSSEAIADLCERTLGDTVAPEFAAACRAATGGNPFFVEALLREAREQGMATDGDAAARVRRLGPAAVAQAVLLRLSGKPAAASALVRAIAVLGDGASLAEAAALAELSEDEASHAADLLVALEILGPAARLEFAHAIVREAVYADVGARERARAHARAAALLASAGAADERVAAQIVAAEPAGDDARVALLRRVAGDALARGAPAAAAAWLRRALAEPPASEARTEVLLALGLAEQRVGAPQAADHLAEAVAEIRDPVRLATAVRQLANALTVSGDSDRAVAALASAIDVVEPADPGLALLLEAELASHALQASPAVAGPARSRLGQRADADAATARLVMASLAFQRARASESASDAAALLQDVLAGGLYDEGALDVVGPFYDVVLGVLATDELDVVEAQIDGALAHARARASIPATAYLTSRRGWVALRRGAVRDAEADGRTAVELLTGHGIPLGMSLATAVLVAALVEGDELDGAEAALRAAGEEIRPGLTHNFLLGSRSILRLASGRTREGLDDLLEFGRRDELWGAANPLASRWGSRAALALDALGRRDEARQMAAEDLARARTWGAPSGIGVALRAVALLDDGDATIELLRESADVLAGSPARLEHARALTDLGAALRRANCRADARPVLEQAIELCDRLGARAVAERARTELSAAGGRSSDPYGAGAAQLTASERRVAELAAEGQSNPEIAQALFVTRKTVETHLGHVYRKLDIAGRGELRSALGISGS